jgi:dTMP kinase
MPIPGQACFLVLEGLDGAGTTTVAGLLKERLQASDLRVRLTAEPTDGAFGRLLRRHLAKEVDLAPSTAALVFTADRADHLSSVIRPALARGRVVISDRYLLSTLAYQGAGGVSMEAVLAASERFDIPDVTFVLEVPEEVRRARMSERPGLERYEEPEFDAELRASYAKAAELLRSRGHRIESIDASKSPSDIVSELIARLDAGS